MGGLLRRPSALFALAGLLGGVALLLVASESRNPPASAQSFPSFATVPFAAGFDDPTYLTHAGDGRIFVVEQQGTVRIISGGMTLTEPFFDLSGIVGDGHNEEGLLSIAFPPGYTAGDWIYVYFTNTDGDIEIGRLHTNGNPNVADETTYEDILVIPHPDNGNHNGGQLQFGPGGLLYAATGDGGSSNCPNPCPARPEAGGLLGRLISINTDTLEVEVIAVGLRNPWRFSFDGGFLYLADVGQGSREEVNVVAFTGSQTYDFGWDIEEGSLCFEDKPPGCGSPDLTRPVFEYANADPDCSITGGYVYQGFYFFGDYCSGNVWAWSQATGGEQVGNVGSQLTSFGMDAAGNLYVVKRDGVILLVQVEPPPFPTETAPATETATEAGTGTPSASGTPDPTGTMTGTPTGEPTGSPTPLGTVHVLPGIARDAD